MSVFGGVFALSGAAALIYQVAWQRLLFLAFGVDLESVTVIVTVFMLGLGVGGMVGGFLADKCRGQCFNLFLVGELLICIFGVLSPNLMKNLLSVYEPLLVFLSSFGLLLFPTLLMGATLPLLSVSLIDDGFVIGDAVGRLYYFNTLGAALGCLLAGFLLFSYIGLKAAIYLAAALNAFAVFIGLVFVGARK
ncbi:fused MFS/spermidine synthase [Microbulbifer elongatus]|uniref:Fused MFS/spermidine synthase n=1 Tax=Microbulbifer elongatus TaxID=86173 RepID=A0ABT1NVV2_9GAMM|nr:fused MFS/spermidine synthase [Microbulbifer elongatus]